MNDAEEVIDAESVLAGEENAQKSELRLWLRLLSATNLISAEIRRNLRESFNVTLPQFDLLAQLERERNGLRLGDLSKRMMVSNGNVTGLVDKLVEQGFVVRETSPEDRRAMNVRMTKAGAALFAVMAKANEGWMAKLFSDVPVEARKALMWELDGVKRSVRRNSGR
ncbi:MAG: MarR family transcriptional regulator [Hyphomicrobiales bacterium]|nr:MarR family transcriptional regulator [Hyphomicrobiales bacterium]